jgi:uncharacterized paraquat-inducible protein A
MSTVITGRALGLLVCRECHCPVRALNVARPRCPRCFAHLHMRKPHSLAVTTVLLILAAILYIPANLLPVMYTRTLFDDERDTIMSGVLVLLQSGSWPIAVLVFVASIVVPLLKILALGIVLYSAWRPAPQLSPATQRSLPLDRVHRALVDAGHLCDISAGDPRADAVLRDHRRRVGSRCIRRCCRFDLGRGAYFR